ncbi:hypothetical protein GCM10009843_07330 [Nocardioides bigeumensis]|uniref:Methyltransferase type 11 domain-containing protein n=1 Tax=Nocardioides bigeumensis TaxID=433657 RepID=A0ABN2XWQ0_9ACTN
MLTSEVFEHVADPGAAFDEIRRLLRRGGRPVFTVPDAVDAPKIVMHMDDPGAEIPVVTDWEPTCPAFLRPTDSIRLCVHSLRNGC